MNAYELFEAMDGIDDEILERSELQRKNPLRFLRPGLIAACCVLVLSVMYAQLRYGIWHPTHPVDPTQETTEIPRQVVDKPYYNQEHILLVMQERLYYTIHQLSEAEIAKVLPERLAPWMRFSADATAYHEDDREGIVRIWLSTPTSIDNVSLEVVLGHYQPNVGYGDDAVVYRCGQVDYILTLGDHTETIHSWHLGAFAEIQGVPVYLEMDVPEDKLEDAKTVFEEALVCFSGYTQNSLDIQIWNQDTLPDYFGPHSWYIEYSRYRLERDTHYSIYLPEEDSKVYTSEEITWSGGYANRIVVSCYKGRNLLLEWNIYEGEQLIEFDGQLLPYQLLYPELCECIEIQDLTLDMVKQYVKKTDSLCVRYGDVTVSVCPHGVNAQWLYDQLLAVEQRSYKAPKQAVKSLQSMLDDPASAELCLKIYYMSPSIFTSFPLSAEDLKTDSWCATISVNAQELSENTDLLKRLNTSILKQSGELTYTDARMCYVFETGDGETVLEIVFNHPSEGIFVNGMAVEYDPVFLEVIAPFATEELKELWMPEDS